MHFTLENKGERLWSSQITKILNDEITYSNIFLGKHTFQKTEFNIKLQYLKLSSMHTQQKENLCVQQKNKIFYSKGERLGSFTSLDSVNNSVRKVQNAIRVNK